MVVLVVVVAVVVEVVDEDSCEQGWLKNPCRLVCLRGVAPFLVSLVLFGALLLVLFEVLAVVVVVDVVVAVAMALVALAAGFFRLLAPVFDF